MHRLLRLSIAAIASFTAFALTAPLTQAQDNFPNRMMTWVVPFSAGGGADVLSRIITSAAYDQFNEQPWRVVNRSGASGVVGWRWILDQPADGYTVIQNSPTALIALMSEDSPPVQPDEIKIVGYINTYYALLIAQPGQPWSDWEGAVAYAKENPGKLTIGGTVSTLLMAGRALQDADIDVTLVSYDGAGPAISDMLGGHISLAATTPSTVVPLVPDQATVVLNSGDTPLPEDIAEQLGNPPMAADVGLHGLSFPRFVGVHPDTPDDVAAQISDRLAKTLETRVVQRMFADTGEQIEWIGMEEAQKKYEELLETLPPLIKRVGVQ